MNTRQPTEEEPHSSPIYVRLGMTKGALIAFALIVLVGIAGFVRLETIASDQKKLIRDNRITITRLQRQEKEHRDALREVCRQGDTLAGLTAPIVKLLQFDIENNIVNELAVPVYSEAFRVFKGYQTALKERPACREITNP